MLPLDDHVTFYDEHSRAVAWMVRDSYLSIYLYDGTPVAWVVDDAIYTYPGRYLGWIEDGWVWDRSGLAAFFTSEAEEAAALNLRRMARPRGERKPRPPLGIREVRPARPSTSPTWSPVSGELFFTQ